VTNLIDNAIKFTAPGGSVLVRVEGSASEARLTVTDTGVGIAAEDLPHVFERLYRADPSRTSAGTGLGLSICRWIVGAHGGTIEATSDAVSGTTFTVILPAVNGR
jgi:signal transduction histidine kinase